MSVGRSQWPRGLRRRSAATRLLRLWVRILPGTWMFFCCECCVLSGRGLCDGLITRPEQSNRLWCVVVWDLEKPQEWGGHIPRLGCKRHKKSQLRYSVKCTCNVNQASSVIPSKLKQHWAFERELSSDDGIDIMTVSMPPARPGRDLASQPAKKWVSESENSSTNPATIQ